MALGKLAATIFVCLGCFGTATTAHSDTRTFSSGGTIVSGTDGLGLFGTAGGNLTGLSYFMSFSFDLSIPHLEQYFSSSSQILGGRVFGYDVSLAFAQITVNGFSQNFTSEERSGLQVYQDGMTAVADSTGYASSGGISVSFNPASPRINQDYLVDQTYFLNPGDNFSGGFGFGPFATSSDPTTYTLFQLAPTYIAVGSGEVVSSPEPSSLSLIAAGMFALGCGRRAFRWRFFRSAREGRENIRTA